MTKVIFAFRNIIRVAHGLSYLFLKKKKKKNGEGAGKGAPFRDKPPPPRLSRKGGLRAGSSINAPIRDNRGGGGGLSRKGVLSSLLYQPF